MSYGIPFETKALMERRALMERCAHWAPCFWLISPKWLTFQAEDMHIREWNNKVLGKSAIKRGDIFQKADPLKHDAVALQLCIQEKHLWKNNKNQWIETRRLELLNMSWLEEEKERYEHIISKHLACNQGWGEAGEEVVAKYYSPSTLWEMFVKISILIYLCKTKQGLNKPERYVDARPCWLDT